MALMFAAAALLAVTNANVHEVDNCVYLITHGVQINVLHSFGLSTTIFAISAKNR